jgi:hypothetical protein
MARSRLIDTTIDLVKDAGAVLWSVVKGEQLELPVTLSFIRDASVKPTGNYIYEAVVVEAKNIAGQTDERPVLVQPGGIVTRLFVRLPRYLGAWSSTTAYNKEEVVLYNDVYYKLLGGIAVIDTTPPDTSTKWQSTLLNKVYVQLPSTLGTGWAVQPLVDSAVYGFFELRVTEPTDAVFTRTFKPVRGMIEILFSPTDDTTDVLNQTVY